MGEKLNFKIITKLDSNEIMQFVLMVLNKKNIKVKFSITIIMSIITIIASSDIYNCITGEFKEFSNLSKNLTVFNIVFGIIFIIVFTIFLINLDKINLKIYRKKLISKNNDFTIEYKLSFYESYFSKESSDSEMVSNITMNYDRVNYIVIEDDLIVIGESNQSIACIKRNNKFETGSWESFLTFVNLKFKDKINRQL